MQVRACSIIIHEIERNLVLIVCFLSGLFFTDKECLNLSFGRDIPFVDVSCFITYLVGNRNVTKLKYGVLTCKDLVIKVRITDLLIRSIIKR